MAVESPSHLRIVSLRERLGDIVQHGGPPQPQVVAAPRHVVHDLERVDEIILVGVRTAALHPLEVVQFGENQLQQTGHFQQFEAHRRHGRQHDLVELRDDPFARDDADARGIAADGVEGLLLDLESQLRGETHGPHHAQGIVREGDVGIARRADDALLQVVHPVERVDQLAERVAVERPGQGVDGEIAAALVVVERSGLDLRFARIVRIGLLAGPYEFDLDAARAEHRRAEGLEDRDFRVEFAPERLGQGDAAADDHHVDIGRWTPQVIVADVSAHDEGPHALFVGQARDAAE